MTVPTKLHFKASNLSVIKNQYKNFFLAVFLVLVITILTTITIILLSFSTDTNNRYHKISLANVRSLPEVLIYDKTLFATSRNAQCTYWDCFNVYRCGHTGHDRISIYVYPLKKYVDERGMPATELMSQEFYLILNTIINSKYYMPDPNKACFFVPSIDMLSQNRFQTNLTSRALNILP